MTAVPPTKRDAACAADEVAASWCTRRVPSAHIAPEASAHQSPALRGSGTPLSPPSTTHSPPRPSASAAIRETVSRSPSSTRPSTVAHTGLR